MTHAIAWFVCVSWSTCGVVIKRMSVLLSVLFATESDYTAGIHWVDGAGVTYCWSACPWGLIFSSALCFTNLVTLLVVNLCRSFCALVDVTVALHIVISFSFVPCSQELRCFATSQWRPRDSIFIRLDGVPACDGLTNRRNCRRYYSALHCKQCGRAVETWKVPIEMVMCVLLNKLCYLNGKNWPL